MDSLDDKIAEYRALEALAQKRAKKQNNYKFLSTIVNTVALFVFVIVLFVAYSNSAKAGEYIELVDMDAQSLIQGE